ncbi:DEAD/DEAH box helicase [Lentibacillus halophilus]|uniref:DEAD/DEAH box helicase n=1 Tax=Lentibacillus halophilus TaxID=295065 RepID=A0ABP3J1R9_9BACI
MKTIDEKTVQQLFPSVVYKRGWEYYNNGLVTDLAYDRNFDIWSATVRGSESYFVEINTADLSNDTLRAYCDCPAFSAYRSCKHIAAVMLEISDTTRNNPLRRSRNYYTSNWLMNAIASLNDDNPAPEITQQMTPLHVEYYLTWNADHNVLLEMKVGEKRCLFVKKLYAFLEDVFNGREHYFTKTFTYNPDTHYFLEQDMAILEQLYAIMRNEQVYVDRVNHHLMDVSERSTVIPPLAAKQLLSMLQERDVTVKADEGTYKGLSIVEDALGFQFHLDRDEAGEVVLNLNDVHAVTYFENYGFLFADGTFYFPEKQHLPIMKQITAAAKYSKTLPIEKEQADAFISQVVPSLQKVGDVQMADDLASDIVQVPLHAKLYLELEDSWIIGKLEYHYGEHQIDPFNGREDDDGIIIRDVEKERTIMNLIEYAYFHYNGKQLYIEADETTLYDFLYHVLPVLDNYLELFITSDIRQLIVDHQSSPSTSVQLESSSNLLEIGFNIQGIDESEVDRVLDAVMEKRRYYRFQDGSFMSLEGDAFSSMQQLFDDLDIQKDDIHNGQVHMPVYRGTQVDELIETPKHYGPDFQKLLHQLKAPEEQVYPLPDNLHAELRAYQNTGYQWFKSLSAYHLGGILADDMGLGKTLQSIAYILSEQSDIPHLIVAPSSVLYNWKNEFDKFAPDLEVGVLAGTPAEREQMIETLETKNVWITSYATIRQDAEQYHDRTLQTLILDEAQYIKNYATKTSRAIRQLKAGRRFALSGTPIENSVDELWAIFQVILPGLMPNQRQFKQLDHQKIAGMTRPFILRRIKEDVLKELPEKIETVHVSELTQDQKELYVGYWRQLQQDAAQSLQEDGFNKSRMKILAGLTRLRQICCHPSVFMENYEGESGKLNQLMETVRNAHANGKRMLIFSQFTSMHDIIMEKLNNEGIDCFYLHGQTPSQERLQMSERFNNGEKSVFLVSLKAGGTGLNLTGADTVILYDLWWNPAVEDQATGRAHRFGQKDVVQVIRLVTEGTIEEKIYDLQQKKRELIDQVIQPGESMLSTLSEDDVRELLNI